MVPIDFFLPFQQEVIIWSIKIKTLLIISHEPNLTSFSQYPQFRKTKNSLLFLHITTVAYNYLCQIHITHFQCHKLELQLNSMLPTKRLHDSFQLHTQQLITALIPLIHFLSCMKRERTIRHNRINCN